MSADGGRYEASTGEPAGPGRPWTIDPERTTVLPFLITPVPFDAVSEFERCRHTKSYIRYLADASPLSTRELAAACRYADLQKFERRRRDWHEAKPVPVAYLKALNVGVGLLESAVAVDAADHARAVALSRTHRRFLVKVLPGVYLARDLPEAEMEETEAVNFLIDATKGKGYLQSFLHVPGVKTVAVGPDGSVSHRLYRPQLRLQGGTVDFGEDGTGFGVARVK